MRTRQIEVDLLSTKFVIGKSTSGYLSSLSDDMLISPEPLLRNKSWMFRRSDSTYKRVEEQLHRIVPRSYNQRHAQRLGDNGTTAAPAPAATATVAAAASAPNTIKLHYPP